MDDDLFEPVPIVKINEQKDIDDAVAKYGQYDRAFVWHAIREDFRKEVNDRWAIARNYCEDNFVEQFRLKQGFSSRLWELNVRYIFRDSLSRQPNNGEPDIITQDLVVECVVPDPIEVPDMQFDGQLYDYPTEEIGRRVTSAIVEKKNQMERRRSTSGSIDYDTTPYVIAVGLPQREFRDAKSMNGLSIVESIMMGAGPLQVTIDQSAGSAEVNISSQGSMTTRNDSEYEIAYFQRDDYKDVSAVLWSTEWTPNEKEIYVLLNPNAKLPIAPSLLPEGVNIITYSKNDDGYARNQKVDE